VFGEVVQGMDVVRRVEAQGSKSGTPRQPVTILNSGELKAAAAGDGGTQQKKSKLIM
jgi:cyclophilin family peptidyl-prolyl cis-trans isomerase